MRDILQDLRFAIRQLQKSPGFACTPIVMLALGICGSVAIFAFVDAALIKPLPYRDQARLVGVFETDATEAQGLASWLDYVDWRRLNKVFQSVDAYGGSGGWGGFTLTTAEGAQHVAGINVTGGLFRTLGVRPVLGRDFRAGEDSPAAPHVVLLSYGGWQKRFGGRPDVLGRMVTLDGVPNVIIGVLPRDFHLAPAGTAEFWGTLRGTRSCEQRRDCHSVGVIGRLKDGVSVQTALANMKSIAGQLQKQYPDSNRGQGANVLPLRDVIGGDLRPILVVLLSGAGLLLFIACINVASLLLSRSDSRRREIAVRNALGASPARLFRQFAAEAVVLAAVGLMLGLISAAWMMQLLTSLVPADVMGGMPFLNGLGLNFRVAGFACEISLIAAVLFAITPVLRLASPRMMEGLKEGSRGSAGTTWRRFGANLVVAELAIAAVLLVSAGLLGRSLYRLLQVDTGLKAEHLATLQLELPPGYTNNEQFLAVERQLLGRVASLPGVQSADVSDQLPLSSWGGNTAWFDVADRPSRRGHEGASSRRVSSGYFGTLQARLLRGRYFTATEDASKPRLAIVNQTLAKQYFPGRNPIGRQIFFTTPPQPPMQIVGVVADIREGPLDAPAYPAIYVPFAQSPTPDFCLAVRTSQAERPLLRLLAAAIHQIDPNISVHDELTMTERINELPSAWRHRSSAWLVGGFAAAAFLLSVVGLYGVIAYSVSQRTREIGVRMALGARPESVHRLVLREAAWLAGAGIALGIGCSIAAATLMRGLLFGIRSWDVPTLAGVAAVLAVSTLLASYIPARRAASVNPVEALRAE